jgi:putative transposase
MLGQPCPIRQSCRVRRCSRRRPYYQARPRDEAPPKAAIARLAGAWPTAGSRRIPALLRREQVLVNRNHGARLRRERGLQGQGPRRRPRTAQSAHVSPRYPHLVEALALIRPDPVWGGAITCVRLQTEFVDLAVSMAVYTRRLRGGHLSRHRAQTLTLTAWRRAWAPHRPALPHPDQGVQYAATAYIQTRHGVGAPRSMAAVGEATANGDAERLMRTIKEAEVALHDSGGFHDAYQQLGRVRDHVDQQKRIQSAWGYLTPVEVETPWLQQQRIGTPIK